MNLKKGDKIISDIIIFDDKGDGFIFKYILDTGADITFITESVFNLLKFKSITSGNMSTGDNRKSPVKLTSLNITLMGHTKFIHVNVGVIPNKDEFDVILGMDIISYCNLEIKTNNNGFNFDIELPSCK